MLRQCWTWTSNLRIQSQFTFSYQLATKATWRKHKKLNALLNSSECASKLSICCLVMQRLKVRKWRNSLGPPILQTCRMPEVETPTFCPQLPKIASSHTVLLHRNPPRSHHRKHVRNSHASSGKVLQFLCNGVDIVGLSGCGGDLTDAEGSFSSPSHPGSYPHNLLCVWVIRVPPPFLVQIRVLSLAVEGPSPCLFDWLELQEQSGQSGQGSVVTR